MAKRKSNQNARYADDATMNDWQWWKLAIIDSDLIL